LGMPIAPKPEITFLDGLVNVSLGEQLAEII
jgi:hypothetical protein